ncbi:MAG: hypothetical protein MPL62_14740 [Alphaproteobacteria bacterium]|nr:hypothetical protein [Alphaproteobacteria bacterium]
MSDLSNARTRDDAVMTVIQEENDKVYCRGTQSKQNKQREQYCWVSDCHIITMIINELSMARNVLYSPWEEVETRRLDHQKPSWNYAD